jgi:hypothetical protein
MVKKYCLLLSDISDDENIEELPDNSDDQPSKKQGDRSDFASDQSGDNNNHTLYDNERAEIIKSVNVNNITDVTHYKQLEDFAQRPTAAVAVAPAVGVQQQADNNSWKMGQRAEVYKTRALEHTEIYKARTLEDINLIYSAPTLISTRHVWPRVKLIFLCFLQTNRLQCLDNPLFSGLRKYVRLGNTLNQSNWRICN